MNSLLTALSNWDLIPCASTATTVTSASPIISAEAVEAVRLGLRIEFERARSPATPPMTVAGRPRNEARGRARLGATIATPMKSPRTPTPRASRRGPVETPWAKNAAKTTTASATAQTTTATAGPNRAKREGGSTEPSRTAAIGGTRVARIAGRRLASTVTIVPSRIETITVRQAKTSDWDTTAPKSTLKRAASPFAIASPRKSPTTDASSPVTRPSTVTTHRICRRFAPTVRSVANSRVRWATVIESVFAITKAPTKSAIAAKASRKYLRNESWSVMSFELCFAWSEPVRTCVFGGSTFWISATSFEPETPGLAATSIWSSWFSLVEERLRGREVEDRQRRARERALAAEANDPDELERLLLTGARDDPHELADLVVLPAGRMLVGRDLVRPVRPAARGELERVELRRPVRAEGKARRAAVPHDLAVLAHELRLVTHAAVGCGDVRQGADPRERRLGERRRVLGVAERLLPGDDRVGARVGGREDRREARVDRVGEHEGAAHHRDAHHDRERGQDQPQLAAEQVLQGDPDHAWGAIASSLLIVSRTSAAVAPVWSSTILPSAR